MLSDGELTLLRSLGVHISFTVLYLAHLRFLSWMRVFLVSVEVHPLSKALQADETEVWLLSTMNQLMPL